MSAPNDTVARAEEAVQNKEQRHVPNRAASGVTTKKRQPLRLPCRTGDGFRRSFLEGSRDTRADVVGRVSSHRGFSEGPKKEGGARY